MKLIVQIPCYNEEATLRDTVADIPRRIDGVDEVEILVIDDGSDDSTVTVARAAGVEHIVQHKTNKGLAQAFRTGIETALLAGADIIVNTDGDNQYSGRAIPDLVRPILEGHADIVIGDRRPHKNLEFSWLKRHLQTIGSFVVRRLSRTSVPDVVSGFRAISREAAISLNIVSPFSYTIEMLIQAGKHRVSLKSVPIETNKKTRDSRLFKNVPYFLLHSLSTMVRIYAMYYPLKIFSYIGVLLFTVGMIPIGRFLYFYFSGAGAGHVQSLVLGGVLLLMGFLSILFALVADLIGFNRELLEVILRKVRRMELEGRSYSEIAESQVERPQPVIKQFRRR